MELSQMDDLDDVIKSVQELESRLLKAILGSFFFSLLPVATVIDRSDWSFRAIVELLGGLMGAAGFLAAYLGSVRHPLQESDVLQSYPRYWGVNATVVFFLAAAMLYLFYVYGKASDPATLLFLAAGNFLTFYGFATAALRIRPANRQKLVWSSMTVAQRVAWVKDQNEREQEAREFQRTAEELKQKIAAGTEDINRDLKRLKANERKRKIRAFFRAVFLSPTYGLRRRLGLLTYDEYFAELESRKYVQEYIEEANQMTIQRVRRNEVKPLNLEGSGLDIFPVDSWKVVIVDAALDGATAKNLLEKLGPLAAGDKGKLTGIMVAIGSAAKVTYEAREALHASGVEVVDERPNPSIGNQAAAVK
jgi:hypothetical protein